MPEPGFCQCGCGGETTIADWSDKKGRHKNGQPRKYLKGHWAKHDATLRPDYRIEDSGCWIWLKGTRHGYGNTNRDGSNKGAHVYYWEQVNGKIPEGMDVHHICENKLCVNPKHLEPLTRAEHMRLHAEAKSIANQQKHDAKEFYKLTKEDIPKIRERYKSGETQQSIADSFGVTNSHINGILHGRVWKDA